MLNSACNFVSWKYKYHQLKLLSYSTQLGMNFHLVIKIKIPTIKIPTIKTVFMLNSCSAEEHKRSFKNGQYFKTYTQIKFHAQLSNAWKKFCNLGAWTTASNAPEQTTGIRRPLWSSLSVRTCLVDSFSLGGSNIAFNESRQFHI